MMRKVKIDFLTPKGEFIQRVDFSGGNEAEINMLGYVIIVKDGYKRVPMETEHKKEPFMKIQIQFTETEEKEEKIVAEATVCGSATLWMEGKTIIIKQC